MSAYNIAPAYQAIREGNYELAAAQLRVFYPAPSREQESTEQEIADYIHARYVAETELDKVRANKGGFPIDETGFPYYPYGQGANGK